MIVLLIKICYNLNKNTIIYKLNKHKMKHIFFLMALCMCICSCNQRESRDLRKLEELSIKHLNEARAYNDSIQKYEIIVLHEGDDTVNVYVRKGEKITDVQVLCKESRNVDVIFNDFSRMFSIFVPKGDKIKTWSLESIETDRRKIKVNVIYE